MKSQGWPREPANNILELERYFTASNGLETKHSASFPSEVNWTSARDSTDTGDSIVFSSRGNHLVDASRFGCRKR